MLGDQSSIESTRDSKLDMRRNPKEFNVVNTEHQNRPEGRSPPTGL